MPAGRYMEQEFCGWCFDELSAESMALSRELGLCDVDCCACDRCLEVSAFLTAPKGWTVPGICLPMDHPWNCYATGRSPGPSLTPSPQDPSRRRRTHVLGPSHHPGLVYRRTSCGGHLRGEASCWGGAFRWLPIPMSSSSSSPVRWPSCCPAAAITSPSRRISIASSWSTKNGPSWRSPFRMVQPDPSARIQGMSSSGSHVLELRGDSPRYVPFSAVLA